MQAVIPTLGSVRVPSRSNRQLAGFIGHNQSLAKGSVESKLTFSIRQSLSWPNGFLRENGLVNILLGFTHETLPCHPSDLSFYRTLETFGCALDLV